MSENVLQTVQHVVQDVIAPDVRELKANQVALEKALAALERHLEVRFETADQKMDARFNAVAARFDAIESQFDALDQKAEARFASLLSAVNESRANLELTNARVLAALSERVAVLETRRQ